MSALKDAVRYAIFEKIRAPDSDITETVMFIRQHLIKKNRIVPDFESKEKFSIGLIVPISLPPGSKPGHCFRVVQEIEKQFNLLGGGSTTYETRGSWLDEKGDTIQDKSIKISTEMLLKDWYIAIDVLRSLIENEIQVKLRQKCVLLYVDGQTFGEPINLVGDAADIFPTQSAFGVEDPDLVEYVREKESAHSSISVHQASIGSDNIQISAHGYATININSNSNQNTDLNEEQNPRRTDSETRNHLENLENTDKISALDEGEKILDRIFHQFSERFSSEFRKDVQRVWDAKDDEFELSDFIDPLMIFLEQVRELKEVKAHSFDFEYEIDYGRGDFDVEWDDRNAVICEHDSQKIFLFMVFWDYTDDERLSNRWFRRDAKQYCPEGFSLSQNRFSFGRSDRLELFTGSLQYVIYGIEIVKDGN